MFAPLVALAQTNTAVVAPIKLLVGKINRLLINPLITLLFVIALVLFITGAYKFFSTQEKGGSSYEEGKRHMIWGLVGMFIMVAVFAIMQIILNTLGETRITL